MKPNPRRLMLLVLVWFVAATFASAQTAFRQELLSLLPDDFGICVIMHDLQGHHARWEKSPWFKAFAASAVGKHVFESREFKQFEKWQGDLQKHLDVGWPELRDDILGDTLLLAYSPGPKNQPSDEHGLILLHVRRPEKLARFIAKLNEAQKNAGDLKALTAIEYKGATYYRREEKAKTQYYFADGPLAAISSQEASLRAFLDKRAGMAKDSAWAKRFQRAGADDAFVTLCVNPRRIEPDVGPKLQGGDAFPSYWRALDAIFVTLKIQDEAELRLSVQADADKLPKWAKPAFTKTAPASSLWTRFPEQSIVTVAARLDFAGAIDGFIALLPEKDRQTLVAAIRNNIKAILELDPFDDVLPNVGPDWGVCVLPARKANELPMMMAAIAVKPGTKKPAIDQALLRGVHTFAGVAVLQHNAKNPDEPISIQTAFQDKLEIKFLSSDKAFPAGLQPACALKDGFLIFASSPEAIRRFGAGPAAVAPSKETPLMRLSTRELAKLLQQRREHILARVRDKNAEQHLENVIALLNLFERVTLTQRGDAGQASWTLRLTPAK